LSFAAAMFAAAVSYASDLYFASAPSLAPDGSQIFFSYAGDIYKADSGGGQAYMVVSMGANEGFPKVSPDGKYLAFSSNVQGNYNVYIVPVKGGEIRQLTYNDATDHPVSWRPDSRYIYFESNR